MAVKEVLCFAKTDTGAVVLPRELSQYYPASTYRFDGANFYYGINPINANHFAATGTALQGWHHAFYEGVMGELDDRESTRVVLGLEPPSKGVADPYAYVTANLGLVEKLATELEVYQARASEQGKTLDITVRFASEMNVLTSENAYAGFPARYRASFRTIREIFRDKAPRILFCFSPAIRSDLKLTGLSSYWPGDDVVDLIACTWYIGRQSDYATAVTRFRTYCRHRVVKGLPFAIDELGGCETVGGSGTMGDSFLLRMRDVILGLGAEGIDFQYVTLFLESKWGESPTLSWVT
jgi:hypothetical protein